MEMTQDELGICVVEVHDQIREADPKAYSGFVSDAACQKVAKAANVKATDALRAYRRFRPLTSSVARRLPGPERKPARKAVEAAKVPCAIAPAE